VQQLYGKSNNLGDLASAFNTQKATIKFDLMMLGFACGDGSTCACRFQTIRIRQFSVSDALVIKYGELEGATEG
jgi:hypothetical protein